MKQAELDEIVQCHAKWLRGEEGGQRANLWKADLQGANLWGANLRGRATKSSRSGASPINHANAVVTNSGALPVPVRK